jgi:carbon monoxide dehydrogenase subunit G
MELEHDFTVPVPVDQAWQVLLDVERIAPCMPGATLDSVEGDEFAGALKVKLGAMTITYKGTARIASRDEKAHTVTIEGMGKESRGSGTASASVEAQLHDEGGQTRVTVHTKLNVTGRPAQFGRNILSEVGGRLISRFAANLAEEITREESPAEPATGNGKAASGTPQKEQAPTGNGKAEEAEPASGNGKTRQAPGPQIAPAQSEPGDGTPQADLGSTTEESRPAPRDDGTPAAEVPGEPQVAPVEPAAGRPARPRYPDVRDNEPQEPPTRGEASSRRPSEDAIDLLEFVGPSLAKRVVPVLAGAAAAWTFWWLVRRSRRR